MPIREMPSPNMHYEEIPFDGETVFVFGWHPDLEAEARRLLHPDEYDSYRRYVAACAAQAKNGT